MPVIDTPVHEKTRQKAGFRNGCHNRKPFKKFYYAPTRAYHLNGSFRSGVVKIPHRMSTDCMYDRSLTDPGCAGCKHAGSGEEHVRQIERNGS